MNQNQPIDRQNASEEDIELDAPDYSKDDKTEEVEDL
jgi:hypothetical protein